LPADCGATSWSVKADIGTLAQVTGKALFPEGHIREERLPEVTVPRFAMRQNSRFGSALLAGTALIGVLGGTTSAAYAATAAPQANVTVHRCTVKALTGDVQAAVCINLTRNGTKVVKINGTYSGNPINIRLALRQNGKQVSIAQGPDADTWSHNFPARYDHKYTVTQNFQVCLESGLLIGLCSPTVGS
jgi:hypothetical protein